MSETANHERALIIVDLQKDFCRGGSLAVNGGDEIVPIVNGIAERFFKVIATRDWHPKGHVSFASAHRGKSPFELLELEGEVQTLWPDHCVQATQGAELHDELRLAPIDLILHKGTCLALDSYSAFFENDHRTSTGLEFYLRGLSCNELYFCGLASDVCVYYSVLDSLRLGFKCTVISDAMRGVDPAGTKRALEDMAARGAAHIDSSELDQ
ncbi:MAG TPA: bifunctional nicotinamidase/pyrazinamidase [Spirochaetia bacterium]|nr:bifunctional nicotinamidase/pyrazinamidase [Spirochaetia bacterium]